MRRCFAWAGAALFALGCRPAPAPTLAPPRAGAGGSSASTGAPDGPEALGSAEGQPPASPPEPPPDAAAPTYPVGELVELDVPGDRSVFVVFAPPGEDDAMLYLHGVCGDPTAPGSFADAIAEFGTLVSLRGDEACDGSARRRWSNDLDGIDRRATRALARVAEVRGEPLDGAALTLLGYSQGALRAEALAGRFPRRYPRVLLMGGPHAPDPKNLASASAVVLMAGERDAGAHLRDGAKRLGEGGIPARFIEIPEARHGEYGPRASETLREALAWAYASRPTGAP